MQTLTRVTLATVGAALLTIPMVTSGTVHSQTLTEAPAGFDGLSNGFVTQAQFEADREVFDETETVDDGLGPVFNMASCGACHGNPVSGGISPVTEERAGHFNGTAFVPHPGDSLIHSSAINAGIQEQVRDGNEVRTFRTSLNTLGDGFVECVDNNTILDIANAQPQAMRGESVRVPIAEGIPGQTEVGRFGWKAQHASLVSFSADAYLNEMGITSPFPGTSVENTSNGNSVAAFDEVADPEDNGDDVRIFARFMRSTKVPPRDTARAATPAAQAGASLFNQIGCNICHVTQMRTMAPGRLLNAGAFTVPPALGNKIIHPFSDFLLHDVGTGDGIVQNGPATTRNKVRTAPLWGVRTRNRLMHDGASLTFNDAILRHAGQATGVINSYRALSQANRNNIVAFLLSL
jgi:CxxC motif-containing protein (DUF1111 family)